MGWKCLGVNAESAGFDDFVSFEDSNSCCESNIVSLVLRLVCGLVVDRERKCARVCVSA